LQLYRVADDGSGIMLLATLPGIPVAADWQPGQP